MQLRPWWVVLLCLTGITASPSAERERLETAWSAYPSVPGETRQTVAGLIQHADREGLPTELLTNRLLEGLAKRVNLSLLVQRLETLLNYLRTGQTLLTELNLSAPGPAQAPCIEGLATLLDWGVSTETLRSLSTSWPRSPACQSLVRAAEWNSLAEKEGLAQPQRLELLREAIAAGLSERLPFLWTRGRSLGLASRQVLAILKRGARNREAEPQILADFERVADILKDVEQAGEPLLRGAREEERLRQRLGSPP